MKDARKMEKKVTAGVQESQSSGLTAGLLFGRRSQQFGKRLLLRTTRSEPSPPGRYVLFHGSEVNKGTSYLETLPQPASSKTGKTGYPCRGSDPGAGTSPAARPVALRPTAGAAEHSWTPAPDARHADDPQHLPALARLLPKLNGVAEVVGTPKFPILKFTAGLAVNPKPPKLNPLAVELAVSSPPNPDRRGGGETTETQSGREKRREERRERKRDQG